MKWFSVSGSGGDNLVAVVVAVVVEVVVAVVMAVVVVVGFLAREPYFEVTIQRLPSLIIMISITI